MPTPLGELLGHNLWANLRLLDACARLPDHQLDATAPGTYGSVRFAVDGQTFAIEAIVPLMQAINHATEHRAQVATVLGGLGVEPPELHPWRFWEERRSAGRRAGRRA